MQKRWCCVFQKKKISNGCMAELGPCFVCFFSMDFKFCRRVRAWSRLPKKMHPSRQFLPLPYCFNTSCCFPSRAIPVPNSWKWLNRFKVSGVFIVLQKPVETCGVLSLLNITCFLHARSSQNMHRVEALVNSVDSLRSCSLPLTHTHWHQYRYHYGDRVYSYEALHNK